MIDDMQGRVDVIIDGGPSDFGLESTIVKIEDDGTLTLLRPGKITPDDLQEIATVRIADAVTDMLKDGEKAISPGMKYRHYAPKSPLLLLDGEPSRAAEYINSDGCKNIAVISYEDDIDFLKEKIAHARFYVFGKREDEQKQAHVLFSILRDADKESYDKIYAPLPAKSGVGLALYNRMIRAAAHTVIKL